MPNFATVLKFCLFLAALPLSSFRAQRCPPANRIWSPRSKSIGGTKTSSI